MAERKARPVWARSFHPTDTELNLNALADMVEVLLPDYPVLTLDLPDAVAVAAGQQHTFDLTVTAAARGTLSYQWQKKTTAAFEDISGATLADYTVATWDDTANKGTYRCVITNTFNNVTALTYSNECVATTETGA